MSAQKSLQPVHDSGWNDPPSWALQKTTTATPTKRLLNKRVAFPMNSNSESSSSITPSTPPSSVSSNTPPSSATPNTQPTPNLPPPPEVTKLTTAPHKPTVAPTGVSTDDSLSSLSELDMNKDEALNNTLYNLNSAISTLDSSKAEEIQKRLEKMESMWKEDKLNSAVYKKVYEISNGNVKFFFTISNN